MNNLARAIEIFEMEALGVPRVPTASPVRSTPRVGVPSGVGTRPAHSSSTGTRPATASADEGSSESEKPKKVKAKKR
jgi:hypothetical protein